MTFDQTNPYASPQINDPGMAHPGVDPSSVAKIEAIIKDAGQFWLAILICIFCSGLGVMIIGPWYVVRLIQWNSLARAQPALMDRMAPAGSLAKRFQSARWKLITGVCFGAGWVILLVLYIVLVTTMS